MQTLDCTDIKALLSPYLDDELDADMRHLAERHFSGCAACRALVDETERLDGLLATVTRADGERELSPAFIGGVMSRTVYAEPARRGVRRWINWAGWSAAAASLAFAGVLWITERQRGMEMAAALGGMQGDELYAGGERPLVFDAPAARTAVYETGATLRSQTFDGPLPVQTFRTRWTEAVDHFEPELRPVAFDPENADALVSDVQPAVELMAASEPAAGDLPEHVDLPTVAVVPQARPAIARDDAETFYATSLVLDALAHADMKSFADVERVRRIAEFDELLPRLRRARERVDAQDRAVVLAAESLLTRVVNGPLDRDDVQVLRDTVAQLELTNEMDEMSLRFENPTS